MHACLSRLAPLLALVLCLTGCGQTGRLFLRMPDVTFPTLAPPLSTQMTPVLALPAGTSLAPVGTSAPLWPTAATHPAPAAVHLAPGASPIR